MKKNIWLFVSLFALLFSCTRSQSEIVPGAIWNDTEGHMINAHGGGMLYHNGTYYWFGEYKSDDSNAALVGVTCYSSKNLTDWKNEGIALSVDTLDSASDIAKGCIIERPKVVYNKKTHRYVMWFHLELRGQGYGAARAGVAVSNTPQGPYKYLHSGRLNPGIWPEKMLETNRNDTTTSDFYKAWTPEWLRAVDNGLYVRRDFKSGQMSRDMTIFVDDDDKAYQIYSSEENLTLQIAELSDDYQSYTGRYIRVCPGGHNEAPSIFKSGDTYWMITSGCTGWAPNEARLFSSKSIWGPWTQHPNPCRGSHAALTFNSQSTYIFPVHDKKNAFIFMADRWKPKHPSDGRYIWLPITFDNHRPVLEWHDRWNLHFFDSIAHLKSPWTLVWSDEFDNAGTPDASIWNFEHGYVRNHEMQYYCEKNAICENGVLKIFARYDSVSNAPVTSSSLNTKRHKEFQYGRVEVRARIPVASGSWPAVWTLGSNNPWPFCGEIDLMEFYRIDSIPYILANVAWGNRKPFDAVWDSKKMPLAHFALKDSLWADAYHIWRMDWDSSKIQLFVDNELLNCISLDSTVNRSSIGKISNPFKQPHYLLLNLAIGGDHGGMPDFKAFPLEYDIDYVRIYKKLKP